MNVHSLRFRLITWYACIFLLICAAFGVYAYQGIGHYLLETQKENLTRRANQIGNSLLSDVGTKGEAFVIKETVQLYAPEANDRFIRITKSDGSLLYKSGEPRDGSFSTEGIPTPTNFGPTGQTTFYRTSDLLIVALPFSIQGTTYLIEVGSATKESQKVLKGFTKTLLFSLPVILLITILGGNILIRRALKPVHEVTQAAEDITLRKMDKRLPVSKTGDEIEELTLALNRMISRLDDSFQHANRFNSDASHELRTPLTVMRGELESVIQDETLIPVTREKIGSFLEETERLAKIVEGLFAISRLEAGEAVMERSRFDLSDLIVTTSEQMSLLAVEKDIAVKCSVAECVEVEGDRARFKQVVVNLLDNAIKYTPVGGKIGLRTQIDSKSAVLEVSDSGPGIPQEALERVFDRFFRADEMRNRKEGGAGLGLSIVRSICLAHGGTVSVENLVDGGCRFTVTIPLASKLERPPTLGGKNPPQSKAS